MRIKLTKKKECRRLTLSGWGVVLAAIVLSVFIFIKGIHSFLSLQNPINAKIMVLDGMFPGYVYDSLVDILNKEGYEYVIATGVEVDYLYTNKERFNTAELSYKILNTKNLKNCRVCKAPSGKVQRDRTFHSAVSLFLWLKEQNMENEKINIASFGAHSRRTWILYKKVFGRRNNLGIISIPDQSYNSEKWFKYAKGLRMVLSETITCLYVKFFFYPEIES